MHACEVSSSRNQTFGSRCSSAQSTFLGSGKAGQWNRRADGSVIKVKRKVSKVWSCIFSSNLRAILPESREEIGFWSPDQCILSHQNNQKLSSPSAFTQRRDLRGATADVVVKVGGRKLFQKTYDICEEACLSTYFSIAYLTMPPSRNANASITCPVEPGLYTVVQTAELPTEVPKLTYVINVRGYTKDDDDMVCVDLTVQFRPFFQLLE
ncbi:hypothetical protein B0H19DRAFT_1235446 [Mycena capillaripes]|nr:hypothetical protein B0H19DRAFT_1235446 [Mycena capillaripes]